MERAAVIIRKSDDGSRCIAVDEENAESLLTFFTKDDRYKKKFNHICELLLGRHRNSELYDKEEFDSRSKGVTVMKFFMGQENARVYCKEITNEQGVFVVIAAEVHASKKSQKLQHKEKAIIYRVAQYEYKKIKEPE